MIIKSSHPEAIIPNGITLPQFVLGQFEKYGSSIAMISPQDDRYYTYADVIRLTHKLAIGLLNEVKIEQGDVLATCVPNCCEFLPLLLSVGLLGCTLTTANPAHTIYELTDHFRKCNVKILVTTSDALEKIKKVQKECPNIEKIIVKDIEIPGYFYLKKLFGQFTSNTLYPKVNSQDTMLLLNSSGTTGLPKAVMLTHYSLIANLCQLCPQFFKRDSPEVFRPTEDDVSLTAFPQFHVGGIMVGLLWPLMCGCTCVIFPRYYPDEFISTLRTYQVTIINVPPPILVFLVKSSKVSEEDCRSIKTIICGAAPITKELSQAVDAKLRPQQIIQAYGMTELSPLCHTTPVKPASKTKHGSCGVVMPNTECKVVDIETGHALGPMKRGEICVRGPQVMKGYLNNPDATAECIDKEGWMHTGDIGHYDEDHYFYIVDRIKELIKVKGFQVAPAELEGILIVHPAVAEAAVVGKLDDFKGEIPCAYVVLKNGFTAGEDEIKNYIAEKVISYKRLEGGVRFVKELPKTASGKILRRFLRDKTNEEAESMAALPFLAMYQQNEEEKVKGSDLTGPAQSRR